MKKRHSLSFITGILIILIYPIFTILAYRQYPLAYSPLDNWLSDLGNPSRNPNGAAFYNTGIIVAALLLMLFFLGLSGWKLTARRPQVILLRLAQALGILGAFCMVMSALFPINLLEIHSFWSTFLYILLSTSFVFLATALRYHPGVPRWLLLLGGTTAAIVILTSFLTTVYILEWITVFLFLSYVCLVGLETSRLNPVLP